jgi:hypothetical protein
MKKYSVAASLLVCLVLLGAALQAQQPSPTPEERLRTSWNNTMKKIGDMAEDFPEDKYTYKAHPDVRTFGEELMHLAMVNTRIARQTRGEAVDGAAMQKEFAYVSKADTVARLKKSIEDISEVVNSPDCLRLIGALEHAGEHYGKLVVYYRVNGLVPPRSRGN